MGNILTKTDVGAYTYNSTKKYAVKTITNGLNISTTAQSIVYNAFNKVQTITEGTKTAEFVYNADRQRIRMMLKTSGATTKTRYYFGGSCEREVVGSTTTQYIWIGGDAYTAVAVATKVGTGSWTVYNIFRDHLGTITHLKTGSTISEYSFDAWGRRRDKDDWSYTLTSEPALFADRGFTAHEFLADFNLYNMNGRLYDPVVGRFLSPDPFISDPSFSQSYNRYSYALNNPLKFTDPTGEKLKWPKFEWFNAIPVIGQFDYLMQFINDNTTKTRQKMVNAGVPNFGAGISFSGNGIVNFSGSYKGQEVFNTGNIDRSKPEVVLNELQEVRRTYGAAWHASFSGGASVDNILGKLFWHNQFGRQEDFVINASSMDFRYTNQKELGIENKNQGEINLFDAGINSYSLAFGVLNVSRLGTSDFFKVETNRFDFDYQSGKSFGRTAGTFVGGATFGQFFNTPITPWSYVRNNSTIGGPFDVIFNYQIYIPKY
jgi:RHS repeat-associated protein